MANYCSNCGKELGAGARFCSACGSPVALPPPPPLASYPAGAARLVRPRTGRVIAGVCQGLALAYGWEVTWVRVIAVLAAVFSSGAGGIAYIIFWIVMPEQVPLLPAPVYAAAEPPTPNPGSAA
jgi:phage shock protein C